MVWECEVVSGGQSQAELTVCEVAGSKWTLTLQPLHQFV